MKKSLLSFIMAIVLVLTAMPINVQAAGTAMLGFRWAGYDNATQKHTVGSNGPVETTLSAGAGSGSPVTLYFVDENGAEQMLTASQVSSSNTAVVTLEEDSEVAGVTHIRYVGVGNATIDYTYNNTTYHMAISVGLPAVGFYTGSTASVSSYITEFTVTDDGANKVYLVSQNVSLNSVTLDSNFSQIATIELSSDKSYAAITIDGAPNSDLWYGVEAEVSDGNGNVWYDGASLRLINNKSSLQYCYGNWSNGVSSPDGDMRNSIYLAKGYSSDVYTYFVSGGNKQMLTSGNLKSSDESIVKVSAHPDYTDMVRLEAVDFGSAKVTYELNGKSYSMDVTVGLPDIGFYTSTTADPNSYITEFTLTDDGTNKIYLVSRNLKMNSVMLNGDFSGIATIELSSDKSYAVITITGVPDNDRWYDVQAEVIDGNGNSWYNGASLRFINNKSSLQYCYGNWSNSVPSPDGDMRNSIYLAKGYPNDVYTYFVSGGNKQMLTSGNLKSSDESIVKVSAHPDYTDMVRLEAVDFGSAKVTYELNGKLYSMDVTVGLPDIGFYTSTTADPNSYITEFTLTDDGTNKIYLVSRNLKMNSVMLNGDFSRIATAELSSDKTYATITVTGVPNSNWGYGVDAEVTDGYGNTWNNGASIKLINGKTSLMFRYAGMNNGAYEDTSFPLEGDIYISKGQNEPTYFYLFKNGQETKVSVADLKSSDESVVKVATYEGSDAIVLESVDFGKAQITYTVNGVTYGLPVEVGLPTVGAYTDQPVVDVKTFINELTVTDTENTFYILQKDGLKITDVTLLRELDQIAKVEVAADNSYALVTVTGMPTGMNYDFEVICEGVDGRTEYFYGNVTLNNGKPYLAFCWPDDMPGGHGLFGTCLDTAVGYATDVWVYLVEGSAETKLSFSDLKSSDESIVKIVDPGYDNGMVNLATVGWGQATVSYTSNGKTYSFDVVSDLQDFGYYKANTISKENWIRSYTVTETDNTFYFMTRNGAVLDVLTPTQELKDIADIALNENKTIVKITITGTPEADKEYGLEFEFSYPNGGWGEGRNILDLINGKESDSSDDDASVSVGVGNLPTVDTSKPVEDVTVGVDKEASEDALEETAKDIVEAVTEGADVENVAQAVVDSIEEALANDSDLEVVTSVVVTSLEKEDVQDASIKADIAAIEKEIGDAKVAQFLDLKVIVTTYVDGVEDASGTVSKLNKAVVFTVALPDELKKVPAGYEREIYVYYVHDGEVRRVDPEKVKVNADGTLSFEASEFSTYTLVYKDTKKFNQSNGGNNTQNNTQNNSQSSGQNTTQPDTVVSTTQATPNTGDVSHVTLYGVLIMVSMIALVVLNVKRRKMR